MDRLAIEFISVLGLPPVAFVELARRLEVGNIGLAATPIVGNPHDYAAWSLRDDPALMRETRSALTANGVTVSLGEGFLIRPDRDVLANAADLDLMAELGAARVNIASIEPDRSRTIAQFGKFADMAADRGLPVTLEFAPIMAVTTLHDALGIVAAAGRPDATMLLDAMHVYRSGGDAATVATLDPVRIGYAQICDCSLTAPDFQTYAAEARGERLSPGQGELPLAEFVAALPRETVVGLEVPMEAAARAGIDPEERLRPAVAAARRLLGGD